MDKILLLRCANFLEEFLDSKSLREAYSKVPLCGLIDDNCGGETLSHVRDYFQYWPGYSGDRIYPVGGELDFQREYSFCDSYWNNQKRLDLTRFVIKRLREDAGK